MLVTNKSFYLLEANKTLKLKHCLPLDSISFVVTQENDKVLMVRIPEELIKKDKVNHNDTLNAQDILAIIILFLRVI